MKEIINKNNKGELHGYQEWYYSNGELYYKGFYNNGIRFAYEEEGYYNCKLKKSFHI